MKTGIYKITNLVNGKMYVGSTVNIKGRWSVHKSDLKNNKHHSIKLQRSYNKYGINNFVYEIIEECQENITLEREQYYIDLYNACHNGYNCAIKAEHPMLGRVHSEETKKKIRESNIGQKRSIEFKNKMKEVCKGRIFTKETRRKMSQSQKGRKHSEETKNKISKSNKGKKWSDEQKNKISINETGRGNKNYNPTPIIQYDRNDNFVKEWRDLISLKEAGFNVGHISSVCRNKGYNKSSAGFIWKFKK